MSESSVRDKLKEAGKHSVIYGIGSIAQSAAGLLLLPILTGALSKEDFGVYSLIIMVSTVASAIFYLGMNSALPRSYYDYSTESDRRAVFTTAFVILLAGSLLQTLVGGAGGKWLSSQLFDVPDYGNAIFWALLSGALTSINGLFFSYLRMLRKSVSTIVYSLTSLVGSVGLTVLLLQRFPHDLRMPFVALAVTQLVIAAAFLLKDGRNALSLRILPAELPKLIPYGVASIFASFGGVLLEWMDRLFIEHYMSLSDVGDYSAVYRVASLMNVLIILPFTQIWSPMMMEYRQHANIKELFSRVLLYLLVAGAALIAVASLFAEILLDILIGSAVSMEMVVSFNTLLLATLVLGTANVLVAGLFYERKISWLACIYYFTAIAKIPIGLLFVSNYGITGAAVSALVCSFLLVLILHSVSRRYFSFPIDYLRIGTLAAVVMLCFYFAELITSARELNLMARSVALIVILFAIVLCGIDGNTRAAIGKKVRELYSR